MDLSTVLVKKKNGQIRVCIDFQDLSKTCSKDDFPFHIIELTVDVIMGHEAPSFLNGSSDYNQIRMAAKDDDFTTNAFDPS